MVKRRKKSALWVKRHDSKSFKDMTLMHLLYGKTNTLRTGGRFFERSWSIMKNYLINKSKRKRKITSLNKVKSIFDFINWSWLLWCNIKDTKFITVILINGMCCKKQLFGKLKLPVTIDFTISVPYTSGLLHLHPIASTLRTFWVYLSKNASSYNSTARCTISRNPFTGL